MSVYSRCVEARGTTSIESTPAFCQRVEARLLLAPRVRGLSAGSAAGVSEEPPLSQYGGPVNPYSDCRASAGTVGTFRHRSARRRARAGELVQRDHRLTRSSKPCTFDTAAAPIEWPMMAIRVVRPGVSVRLSGERSNSCQ